MENDKYITFHAGCGIWEIAKFDEAIEWHHDNDVFVGTYIECLNKRNENNIRNGFVFNIG